MLGRVRRPSISSLEQLELERPPLKIIKDDPLSIYESTLRKLKEGSQRCKSLPPEEATTTDISHKESCCSDTISPGCLSCDGSHNSSIFQSMSPSKGKRDKNISVLYLFSKYMIPKNKPILPDAEAMVTENACSPDNSSLHNQCEFISSPEEHMQEKCIDSLVI
ncbi:hypothetical protein M9H77_09315 [Catharanthus roseus]|uniref:Uncharacterized protein n=1 Tax=Catharanthus roseus TaxID=4058 RepID=A0ACC0C0B2_CATRO|nr:hypothetical protein M9H77_09315 [Catharanthus roseus]